MATIGSYSKPEEAHLVRARLEAAGIPAFLRDEFTIQMNWMYSNALGGIRVEVAEENLKMAREIIDLPVFDSTDDKAAVCPHCGSQHAGKREWPRRISYLSLLVINFPLLLSTKDHKCHDCGHTWR